MKHRLLKTQILILIAVVFVVANSSSSQERVKGTFLYNLSNFTGPISYNWPRVRVNRQANETYVIYQNLVRIFNQTGMEIYSFGDELDLGSIVDLAVDQNGNILLLSHKWSESAKKIDYEITRCNYRGEPISKVEVKNLPSEFSKFLPNCMVYEKGNLYLVSLSSMVVVVTDSDGVFKEVYNIRPLLELDEKEKQDAMMQGFSIDKEGNFLFTIPPVFRAYKISPDRKVSYFGKPGAGPGRFNIVAGIVADTTGNILVVDKLKCAIMVYDNNFNFLGQFGSRGWSPGSFIAPDEIDMDNQDRIYVTQAGKKGVSVFKITYH
jgi:DNA-binding beta-propeller fold protein YncE